ncbi:MAG TPA: FkbM family methyltransferase [Gemmatimonas sp.]|nr:FkbM family methyltransferase [Gemmatimonas sp.]
MYARSPVIRHRMLQRLLDLFRPRKPFTAYEYRVTKFQLPKDGEVSYAQWQHPGEVGKAVLQENVDFFRNWIREGDFVIDIGAHEGDTTVPMALAAGASGLTLGLEPNPHVFRTLEMNASLNPDKTRIIPLHFAATATDGEFTFGSGDPSYGNGGIVGFTHNKVRNTRYTMTVQGRNLEKYLLQHHIADLPRLRLIKVDAEGYDKEIIKNMLGIVRRYRPVILTEVFGPSTDEEKRELFTVLAAEGYSMSSFIEFIGHPTDVVTLERMTGRKTFNLIAVPMPA